MPKSSIPSFIIKTNNEISITLSVTRNQESLAFTLRSTVQATETDKKSHKRKIITPRYFWFDDNLNKSLEILLTSTVNKIIPNENELSKDVDWIKLAEYVNSHVDKIAVNQKTLDVFNQSFKVSGENDTYAFCSENKLIEITRDKLSSEDTYKEAISTFIKSSLLGSRTNKSSLNDFSREIQNFQLNIPEMSFHYFIFEQRCIKRYLEHKHRKLPSDQTLQKRLSNKDIISQIDFAFEYLKNSVKVKFIYNKKEYLLIANRGLSKTDIKISGLKYKNSLGQISGNVFENKIKSEICLAIRTFKFKL
jgi:hypothetical protein